MLSQKHFTANRNPDDHSAGMPSLSHSTPIVCSLWYLVFDLCIIAQQQVVHRPFQPGMPAAACVMPSQCTAYINPDASRDATRPGLVASQM